MLNEIINLLYPAICQACGDKTPSWNQHVCDTCAKKIKNRLPPFCAKCGKQLNGEPDMAADCGDCRKEPPHLDRAHSACFYDSPLKELVHNFKYKKATCLEEKFGGIIMNFMKKYGICGDAELVASVPMHHKRLFSRDINHSEILAKNIAKKLGLPYSKNLIKKTRNTGAQAGLKRHERLKNISGSFSLNGPAVVKNKKILLVDDLFTTGSTLNECARLLKQAGASRVEAVTLARGDATT